MENADKIRKRIKKIYIELFLLSIVLAGSLCVVEKWVLTSSTIPHESMGCFILSIFLIEIVIISVINAFMIIWVLKEPDSWDCSSLIFFGTIFNIFLYIITVICLIVKKIRPNNGWLVLLGVLLSLAIVIILELIACGIYVHMGTMSKLYGYSLFWDLFYESYDREIQKYNSYVRRYNQIYRDINEIEEKLEKKVHTYKEIDEYESIPVPQYDDSNLHLLYCAYGADYIGMAEKYISRVKKDLEKSEKYMKDMEMIFNLKEEYVQQMKRTSDWLDNSIFADEHKKIFHNILNMEYNNEKKKLVKKSIFERRIKLLRR